MREVVGVCVPKNSKALIEARLRNANYERHQACLARKYLLTRHRVLEGGAGIGFVTRVLTERCESVISVEANAELWEVAQKNAPGANILNRVLSGKASGFFEETAHTGDAFGVGGESKAIPIDVDTLIDAFRCNALILDVEGEEGHILNTMKRLDALEVLIVEMHPDLAPMESLAEAHIRLLQTGFEVAEEIADGPLMHVCYTRGGEHK